MPERKRKIGPDPNAFGLGYKARPESKSGPKPAGDLSEKTRPRGGRPAGRGDKAAAQRVETRRLLELKPHPRQSTFFKPLKGRKLRELAESIKAEGLKVPVEILPDGTIVCGHGRVAAAKHNGQETIEVTVRPDLAALGEAAVELRPIRDNLDRRQLSPLAQARAFQRVKELGRRRPVGELSQGEHEDLRDRLVEEFGMSARNVDRYLAVLRAPVAVQEAFDRGELPLALAARGAHLAPEGQSCIAREIEAGGPAAEVVRGHIAGAGDAPKAARAAYLRLLRHLEAACSELDGEVGRVQLKAAEVEERIATLERAAALIGQLREREEGVRRRHEALLRGLGDQRRRLGHDGEDLA